MSPPSIALLITTLLLAGCNRGDPTSTADQPPPVEVGVETVTARDLPACFEYVYEQRRFG